MEKRQKQTPQKKTAQEKMKRLLIMMRMMRPPGNTLHDIADELGLVKRSVERYVKMFEEAGFGCDKDEAGRYFMFEPHEGTTTLVLSQEDAEFLSDLIAQAAAVNPLAPAIQTKLFLRCHAGERVKNRFRINVPEVIQALTEAMKSNRQVELNTYYSAFTGKAVVRLLEPLKFTENYQYLLAYEAKDQRVVNLKIDRIKSVKILDALCTQKPSIVKGVDVFQIASNDESHEIAILLNPLAYRLLIEEYPATEPYIFESEDERFPFRFAATVYNFLPLGRFCLGLPGAVKVEENESFLDYLRKKMLDYTW
jgi:predicted DNA-binding transcriptional regulator YafY